MVDLIRVTGSQAERARVNVTRAVKKAVDDIEKDAPAIAAHLRASVRTGTYCSYSPDERIAVRWRAEAI